MHGQSAFAWRQRHGTCAIVAGCPSRDASEEKNSGSLNFHCPWNASRIADALSEPMCPSGIRLSPPAPTLPDRNTDRLRQDATCPDSIKPSSDMNTDAIIAGDTSLTRPGTADQTRCVMMDQKRRHCLGQLSARAPGSQSENKPTMPEDRRCPC